MRRVRAAGRGRHPGKRHNHARATSRSASEQHNTFTICTRRARRPLLPVGHSPHARAAYISSTRRHPLSSRTARSPSRCPPLPLPLSIHARANASVREKRQAGARERAVCGERDSARTRLLHSPHPTSLARPLGTYMRTFQQQCTGCSDALVHSVRPYAWRSSSRARAKYIHTYIHMYVYIYVCMYVYKERVACGVVPKAERERGIPTRAGATARKQRAHTRRPLPVAAMGAHDAAGAAHPAHHPRRMMPPHASPYRRHK